MSDLYPDRVFGRTIPYKVSFQGSLVRSASMPRKPTLATCFAVAVLCSSALAIAGPGSGGGGGGGGSSGGGGHSGGGGGGGHSGGGGGGGHSGGGHAGGGHFAGGHAGASYTAAHSSGGAFAGHNPGGYSFGFQGAYLGHGSGSMFNSAARAVALHSTMTARAAAQTRVGLRDKAVQLKSGPHPTRPHPHPTRPLKPTLLTQFPPPANDQYNQFLQSRYRLSTCVDPVRLTETWGPCGHAIRAPVDPKTGLPIG